MKRKRYIYQIVIFAFLLIGSMLISIDADIAFAQAEKSTVVFFYVNFCDSCHDADKFLDDLAADLRKTNDGLTTRRFNTAVLNNYKMLEKYFEVYNVPEKDQRVPIAFVGDTFFSGEKAINQGLKDEISKNKGIKTIQPEDIEKKADRDLKYFFNMNIFNVFLAGLINGVNPCSMSMLLFLLSILIVKSINIMKIGAVFCTGKFIAYFFLGTIFFELFSRFNFSGYKIILKAMLIILIIILIVLNINDSFAAKKEEYNKIRLQLPAALRKINHDLIKKISCISNVKLLLLMSFVLGMIISVFEFLCTGQIYLLTIIYVLQGGKSLNMQALFYFLVYNTAFIIPLLILTYVISRGKEIFEVSEVIREKLPLIKKINVALFFMTGIIILIVF